MPYVLEDHRSYDYRVATKESVTNFSPPSRRNHGASPIPARPGPAVYRDNAVCVERLIRAVMSESGQVHQLATFRCGDIASAEV